MARISLMSRNRFVMANNQANLGRVTDLQDQLSSGRRVRTISDDPIAARRALGFRVDQFRGERFLINIERSDSFLQVNDTSLTEMNNLLAGVKEIAVEGANGTLDPASRRALADSVDAHLTRLIDLANTSSNGRFIFAGTAVSDKPFVLNTAGTQVEYRGNLDDFEVNISATERAALNQNGFRMFKESVDVFEVLIDLRDALQSDDPESVGELIDAVDTAQSHIGTLQGETGARLQRLDLTKRQLEEFDLQLSELISAEIDVDMTEAILKLQVSQVALEAGLQTSARVLQPTLLDFL